MGRLAKTSIRVRAELPYRLSREAGWTIATCDLLSISTQGKTERSAKRNLKDAIALFIEGCMELGTLDDVLAECGFHSVKVAGQAFWAAEGPGGARSGMHRLRLVTQVKASARALKPPRLRAEHIPSLLPWLIQARPGKPSASVSA
jgi:predicted RNase H-like HicB family nuclease